MPKLYSYVVARDFGFAPNPFYGFCTLATCKPQIRENAQVGDWIIGTGSKLSKPKGREGHIVYAMHVSEVMTFNEYWQDCRFQEKRPDMYASISKAFGDNIYFKDKTGQWIQQDSHHSYANGNPNPDNIYHDTKVDRVLISMDYVYWGGSGPTVPLEFRNYDGYDICAIRNHKSRFPDAMVRAFAEWFKSLTERGYCGVPLDW